MQRKNRALNYNFDPQKFNFFYFSGVWERKQFRNAGLDSNTYHRVPFIRHTQQLGEFLHLPYQVAHHA